MNSYDIKGSSGRWTRAAGTLMAFAALAMGILNCDGGREGDRCVLALSHNDCNAGLVCQIVSDPNTGATCGESYCCPSDPTTSTNDYCNGKNEAQCPGGTDAGPVSEVDAETVDAATGD